MSICFEASWKGHRNIETVPELFALEQNTMSLRWTLLLLSLWHNNSDAEALLGINRIENRSSTHKFETTPTINENQIRKHVASRRLSEKKRALKVSPEGSKMRVRKQRRLALQHNHYEPWFLGDLSCLKESNRVATSHLERHSQDDRHGDVCRLGDSLNFVCPEDCVRISGAPFCGSTTDETHRTWPPCRIPRDMGTLEAQAEGVRSWRAKAAAAGDTARVAALQSHLSKLERHIAEQASASRNALLAGKLPMLVPARASPGLLPSVKTFFFHVPKAAGTTVERTLAQKLSLFTLPAGDASDLGYIERSQALSRGVIDYLKTPMFADACAFLARSGLKARVFTVLRDPVDRLVSMYRYKKISTWEKNYDPQGANQSMQEFLDSPDLEVDWLVYSLASSLWPPQRRRRLRRAESHSLGHDEDFKGAKAVLAEFVIVGFVDDLDYSLQRISRILNWDLGLQPFTIAKSNENTVKLAEEETESQKHFVKQLTQLNARDVALYREARLEYDKAKRKNATFADM